MNVQDTCTTKCKFWKKYKENCPFFMETLWAPHEGSSQPKTVKDCAPKRSLILQMETFAMIQGLHTASNQERNLQHNVLTALSIMAPDNPLLKAFEKIEDAPVVELIEGKHEQD